MSAVSSLHPSPPPDQHAAHATAELLDLPVLPAAMESTGLMEFAEPQESADQPLPQDPTPALFSPTSAHAKPKPDPRDLRDPAETMVPPETRDQPETTVLLEHRDHEDPLAHPAQLETQDQGDPPEHPDNSAQLPLHPRDAPAPLDAKDHVEPLASLVAMETMDAQEPPGLRATVATQAPSAAQEPMDSPVNLVCPAPQEAATTAHPPVWPMDIKRLLQERQWSRTTRIACLYILLFFVSPVFTNTNST